MLLPVQYLNNILLLFYCSSFFSPLPLALICRSVQNDPPDLIWWRYWFPVLPPFTLITHVSLAQFPPFTGSDPFSTLCCHSPSLKEVEERSFITAPNRKKPHHHPEQNTWGEDRMLHIWLKLVWKMNYLKPSKLIWKFKTSCYCYFWNSGSKTSKHTSWDGSIK